MFINGVSSPVFPLSKCKPNWHSYFMAADGTIYSTRKSPMAYVIRGSNGYVTLGSVTSSRGMVVHVAKRHSDFKMETAAKLVPPPSVVKTIAKTTAKTDKTYRHHAKSLHAGVDLKGWIIGEVTPTGALLLSKEPKVHLDEVSVKNELERLALAHPAVRFISLKVDHCVIANGISWS